MDRDDKIAVEAIALWMALFGEPPIIEADGSQILDVVVQTLPVLPYAFEEKRTPGVKRAKR